MKDIVISEKNVKTSIQLNNHEFEVILDLGLVKGGDFWMRFKFKDLEIYSFRILQELSRLTSEIPISSVFFKKNSYPITHIVVEKHWVDSNLNTEWECFSDVPTQLTV